ATPRIRNYLLEPLAKALKTKAPDWDVDIVAPEGSTKARLARLAGGEDTPAVLFTGCHGMGFPSGDPRQRSAQGALLCQAWPGRAGRGRPSGARPLRRRRSGRKPPRRRAPRLLFRLPQRRHPAREQLRRPALERPAARARGPDLPLPAAPPRPRRPRRRRPRR